LNRIVNYYSIGYETIPTVRNFRILTITNVIIVLTLLKVFTLGHYDPPSTGRIYQLAYSTSHKWRKQGVTELSKLLNKYLLMVTFEYGKNFRFDSKFLIIAHYVI